MPFAALGLSPKITRAVAEEGYERPTPIQAQAIPPVLEGRDLIGIAQTGTGKTAAFVLPILERLSRSERTRNMRALVVAPTRELAVQIDENLRAYARHLDLRFTTIYGGVAEGPQIEALRRGVDIAIATPGRLLDLMNQKRVFFNDLQTVVLDEADRMLDMGFLPSIRQIVRALPEKRQTLLFSATMSREIERIAADFLNDPVIVEIGARATPIATIAQVIYEVPKASKVDLLTQLLEKDEMKMVLVFSRTKHGADKIARKLAAAGISNATIHSNRTQAQRLRALQRFRNGEVRVLVATDIAARGIDVDGISHVINFDFPPQPEDYVHRIGRTGRAEANGDAISFVSADEYPSLHKLERLLGRRVERRTPDGIKRHDAVAPVIPIRPATTAAPRSFAPRRRTRP